MITLTLTGPPGSGKSSLANEIAAAIIGGGISAPGPVLIVAGEDEIEVMSGEARLTTAQQRALRRARSFA